MFGLFKNYLQDPATLREHELEEAFIATKKTVRASNPYKESALARRNYERLDEILGHILERHKHFVLDVEAKFTTSEIADCFSRTEHHDSAGTPYTEYAVRQDLWLRSTKPELLLYLSFFLYAGGRVKGLGVVEQNLALLQKLLDHLILERDYAPALFFKGLALKYGMGLRELGQLEDARSCLEGALKRGVGAAGVELTHLWRHKELLNDDAGAG